jgi:methionyl-tRNA synthetase
MIIHKNTEVRRNFIGAAWPYVNGDVHVGHLVGYMLPCDIFARFSRLKGWETLLVSGTDCHGTPITLEADKRGVKPSEIVDIYDPKFRELINIYNISYDLFTKTTTENHKKVSQDMFVQLLENGFIFKDSSKQYFSPTENKFLPDRYVEGECPYCHAKDQRADQCENCGRSLGMGELINPKSKLTGSDVILKETEHYFIDFPKLQSDIYESISNQSGTKDWVIAEARGWIKEGLQPRAITRDIDWGIEIPKDRIPADLQIDNIDSKKFYVWYEAVIGYLSAAIEWSNSKISPITNDTNSTKPWELFWKNSNTKHYYFMGQDNLAFHMIFWPGQIIGSNQGYNLPDNVSIVKFLNFEGKKFSKSRGVFLGAKEITEYFDADLVRFYLSLILPENKQTDWNWEDFKNRINGDLVGNVGNFINRVLVFYKNKLELKIDLQSRSLEKEIEKESQNVFSETSKDLEDTKFVSALNKILKYSTIGNQYFDHSKPWESIKTDRAKAEKVIFNCLQIVYDLRALLTPFIPNSMNKLSQMLGIEPLSSQPQTNLEEVKDSYCHSSVNLDIFNIGDLKTLFSKVEEIPENI